MDEQSQIRLLVLWLVVTGLALIAMVMVIVWAVRSRQFSDQDRARYLPLDSSIPRDDPNRDRSEAESEPRQ